MSNYFDHPLFLILTDELPSGPREQLAHAVNTNDLRALVNFPVNRNPKVFADAHYPVSLSYEIFLHELFRKASDLPLGVDTSAVAIDSFLDAENKNRIQNARMKKALQFFNKDIENKYSNGTAAETTELFLRIREQIRLILGSFPKTITPKITSGATYDLKRGSTLLHRLADKPSITEDALVYLRSIGEIQDLSCPYPYQTSVWSARSTREFSLVRGSRYGSVPKKWDTDRSCDFQPTVNIAYQCGIGQEISSRLKRFGIDLSTKQEEHADLALFASLDASLATLDLINASNTIVTNCISLLFPSDWVKPMMALRTDSTWFPSTGVFKTEAWHRLQMMSGNGNGFTFEMESVLFLAICLASSGRVYKECPEGYSVYGDDLFVPTDAAQECIKALRFYGFEVNMSKSYYQKNEYFRESCGTDAFNGYEVRGINLKQLPTKPIHWFRFLNALRHRYYYSNMNKWVDEGYHNIWLRCIECLPRELQLFGPRYLGESVIHHEDEFKYKLKDRKWGNTNIKRLMLNIPTDLKVHWGYLINKLRSSSSDQLTACLHSQFEGYGFEYRRVNGRYDYSEQFMPEKHILPSFDDKDDWYTSRWTVYHACAGITVSDPAHAHRLLIGDDDVRHSKLPLFLKLSKDQYVRYREALLINKRRELISILKQAITFAQEEVIVEDDFDPSQFV